MSASFGNFNIRVEMKNKQLIVILFLHPAVVFVKTYRYIKYKVRSYLLSTTNTTSVPNTTLQIILVSNISKPFILLVLLN